MVNIQLSVDHDHNAGDIEIKEELIVPGDGDSGSSEIVEPPENLRTETFNPPQSMTSFMGNFLRKEPRVDLVKLKVNSEERKLEDDIISCQKELCGNCCDDGRGNSSMVRCWQCDQSYHHKCLGLSTDTINYRCRLCKIRELRENQENPRPALNPPAQCSPTFSDTDDAENPSAPEDQYQCGFCEKSFSTRSRLYEQFYSLLQESAPVSNQTTSRKTKRKSYICELCPKSNKILNSRSDLYRHYSLIHFKKQLKQFVDKLKCKICGVKKRDMTELLRHVGSTHDKVDEFLDKKYHVIKEKNVIKSGQVKMKRKLNDPDQNEESDQDDRVGTAGEGSREVDDSDTV